MVAGESRVLYGGCFVKSTDAEDLGNLGDARPAEWPMAIKKVAERYPAPAWIIPGHGNWKSIRSLQHTLDLLKAYQAEK